MISHTSLVTAIAFAAISILSSPSKAEPTVLDTSSTSLESEYSKRIRASETIESGGPEIFGDSINAYTGNLTFEAVDASIPGNSTLPVEIKRRYSVEDRPSSDGNFGDWELELPHIGATYTSFYGWVVGNSSTDPSRFNRCSAFAAPPTAPGAFGGFFEPSEYWHGVHLRTTGGGSQEILQRAAPWEPTDGQSYPLVTAGRWVLRCLSTTASGEPGEAFLAISPDGTRYQFDWLAKRPDVLVSKTWSVNTLQDGTRSPVPGTYSLGRSEYRMLPTRITDRYGNWVQYHYDTSSGADHWRLLRISSSDQRELTLTYVGSTRRIRTVSDGVRTWTYSYDPITNALSEVLLPDNQSRWTFELTGLNRAKITYATGHSPNCFPPGGPGAGTFTPGTVLAQEVPPIGTITHPAGATATFEVAVQQHGRSYMPARSGNCVSYDEDNFRGYAHDAEVFDTLSLTKKIIEGPGIIAPLQWTYAYSPLQHSAIGDECEDQCTATKWLDSTDPEGVVTRHTFGTRYQVDEGQLLRLDIGWNGKGALRTELYRYRQPQIGQPYPEQVGISYQETGDAYMSTRLYPQDQRIIQQDGADFSWTAQNFDGYASPTSIVRSSSLGHSRTESTTYHHNTNLWAIGQVESVLESSTGLAMEQYSYDPVTATRSSASQFSRPATTYSYYSDGLPHTTTDGDTHTTTFNDYFRGVPREVIYADTSRLALEVSGRGDVTKVTPPTGFSISHLYDVLGYLSKTSYPAGDDVQWNEKNLTFTKSVVANYGIAPGHWKQSIQVGNQLTETYFDGLWRPAVKRSLDISAPTLTERIVLQRFNSKGHSTFVSYPVRTIGGITDDISGTKTIRDALGRELDIVVSSELGDLTTYVRYESNFTKVVIDPKSNTTRTTFQAFDEPDESSPLTIDQEPTAHTGILRDVFGNPQSVTRSGNFDGAPISATRSYVYDGTRRLCKVVEPESGSTVLDFTGTNLLAWKASGQSLPSTTSCDRGSVVASQKVSYDYDNLNRLEHTVFGDGSPTISRTYTPDGLPDTVSADNIVWDSDYNRRRLATAETLTINGVAYALKYGFDVNGNRSSLTYPDSTVVSYEPNALGEVTRVGNYATQVTTYANGGLKGFRYGNGVLHSTEQNIRGLPSRNSDSSVVDDAYTYDQNGNLTKIEDDELGVFTRTLTYDDLNRLTVAENTEIWGGALGFVYDPLDNLRRSTGPAQSWIHEYAPTTNRLERIVTDPARQTVVSYQYDSRGRAVARSGKTFVVDLADRVTAVEPDLADYRYDGHGRRTLVTKGEQSTVYVYSPSGQLLFEAPAGVPVDRIFANGFQTGNPASGRRYVYLANSLIAQEDSAGRRYLHTDAAGSPVAKTNAAGAVLERTYLLPYGRTVSPAQAGPGFGGHVTDLETGLSYMQARYYDPWAARFLAVDPLSAQETGFNRYAYASNTPYGAIDRDGRASRDLEYEYKQSGAKPPAEGKHTTGEKVIAYSFAGAVIVPIVAVVGVEVTAAAMANPYGAAMLITHVGDSIGAEALGGASLIAGAAVVKQTVSRSLNTAVEQYALRASKSGFYPVMTRGSSTPTALTWLEKGEVWKFGTTKNPATRYSQEYLTNTGSGLQYSTEWRGTLVESLQLEKMKIQNYRLQNAGDLPSGNKIVR